MPLSSSAHLSVQPSVDPTAFVASTAVVLGDVTLGAESSVWYAAVVRGDIQRIVIGARSNIQDGCVVHLSHEMGCYVGENVTVGHKAILHACRVDDEVLIGMGAIILDGAEIGARSIIGAGALVTGRTVIPPGSLVLGSPAKVIRRLSQDEQQGIKVWADHYVDLLPAYKAGLPRLHPGG